MKEAAAKALNDAADKLEKQIKQNMDKQGIKNRTGNLRGSLTYNKATPKRLNVMIKSEVFVKAPRRPGLRNPAMKNRYKYGVPYGRLIEFSPRINRPFFYTAWYSQRSMIKENVMEAIQNAWSR